MKLLITGGCGFLGSNLAAHAIGRGDRVRVFDNLSRLGSESNRAWLETIGGFEFQLGDIRDAAAVERAIREYAPDVIFHLAGQVAMTTSLQSPRLDFEINALGTLNVLEVVRQYLPDCGVIYSSTNKVYGDLEQFHYEETETRYTCVERPNGFDETTPFNAHSPYGCSKGTADLYIMDYARMFGLKTATFRHSSMYGGRQFATADQGWIGWFCGEALRIKNGDIGAVQISGNGKQVRDVLHAEDMVNLYFAAADRIDAIRGQAFNVGGGMANSLSLRELFALIGELEGIEMRFESGPPRESDQKVFVADLTKAERLIEWRPKVDARTGISRMLDWSRSIAQAA
jgi:CDP-paratose 2-epimerase